MGKFEKLVVLTVLFAAAIVLAVSLNRGGKDAKASDPLSGADQVLEQEGSVPETAPPGDDTNAPPEVPAEDPDAKQAQSPLLNAGPESANDVVPPSAGEPGGAALSLDAQADPTKRILRDANGLRPSFMDTYMVYTAAEGDTWAGLAQRFYQDGRYTRNLLRANDEMPTPVAGTQILVPVFDLISADAGLQPGGDAPLASASTPAPLAPGEVAPAPAPEVAPSAEKPLEYVVKEGDTLSDISLAVFGTSTRWKEILEANKDKLSKPESLQVGMKLRIPAGGKLPAAGAAPKKPESKPKTAQADKAAPKKKKVL